MPHTCTRSGLLFRQTDRTRASYLCQTWPPPPQTDRLTQCFIPAPGLASSSDIHTQCLIAAPGLASSSDRPTPPASHTCARPGLCLKPSASYLVPGPVSPDTDPVLHTCARPGFLRNRPSASIPGTRPPFLRTKRPASCTLPCPVPSHTDRSSASYLCQSIFKY